MRKLTFPGFMEQYVISLSYGKSGGIYPLAKEATTSNPRLREPLFLYALATKRVNTLLTASRNTLMFQEYYALSQTYTYDEMIVALSSGSNVLSDEYQKVWQSYQATSKLHERDIRVKGLIRNKVVSLQEKNRVSTYRICKDLNLNNANVNAWLKHDSSGKVSLDVARKVLSYLEQTSPCS